MMMTRRSEYKRHLRWDIAGVFLVVLFVIAQPHWRTFKESRFYRDFNNITPFTDVRVFGQVLEPDGIIINGSMIKVRCQFDSLVAYVELENGLAIRTVVDTSVEDARGASGNRPPSPRHQMWGPWKIRYAGGLGRAVGWDIYASHINCPDEPTEQTNLFARGRWATTRKR